MTPLEAHIASFIGAFAYGEGQSVALDEDLLLTDLLDSLGVARLVAHLETKLAIQIPLTDVVYDNLQSVQALADYLSCVHGITEVPA